MGVVRRFLRWLFFPWRSAAKWKTVAEYYQRQAHAELKGTARLISALKDALGEKQKVEVERDFYKALLSQPVIHYQQSDKGRN